MSSKSSMLTNNDFEVELILGSPSFLSTIKHLIILVISLLTALIDSQLALHLVADRFFNVLSDISIFRIFHAFEIMHAVLVKPREKHIIAEQFITAAITFNGTGTRWINFSVWINIRKGQSGLFIIIDNSEFDCGISFVNWFTMILRIFRHYHLKSCHTFYFSFACIWSLFLGPFIWKLI